VTDGGIAITAVGVGVAERRLPISEIGAAWGRGGRGQVAVCSADEDTLTLAWTAADAALAAAGRAGSSIDGLWWGTTRPPFAEGPSWSYLAAALGLGGDTHGALLSGSPHSGLDALLAAADAVAAGRVTTALVVGGDALLPGAGSGFEAACGAGAVAVIVQAGDGPAIVGRSATRHEPVLDRYRGDREDETRDVYDGRLFREEIFLPIATRCAGALSVDGATRWSLPDPDGRLGAALAKSIGAGTVSSADHRPLLGDLGAGAALAGLVPALAEPGPAALLAFGGGRATAVAIDVAAAVPGAGAALAALDATGRPVSYAEVLRNRGQLVAVGEQVEMAVPPGSAMFVRDNHDVLALLGARCVACDTINFPPAIHPSCTGCGGDKFTEVALARTGSVQTFVVNHTMPAPFVAPLPLVCVDLDDGSRVMFQGVGTGDDLAIGDRCRLVLRRYSVERGVPVYGWKVARA
jgi:hydroxymethylglutaryl-CoA synthase